MRAWEGWKWQLCLMVAAAGCGDTVSSSPDGLALPDTAVDSGTKRVTDGPAEDAGEIADAQADHGPSDAVDDSDVLEAEDTAPTLSQPCDPEGACALKSEFASEATHVVVIEGIFAIWWEPGFDHAQDSLYMLEKLQEIREECLMDLGMADPPNPAAGYYYNVYIHHGEADSFPNGWANGQGTDSFGMPFLTLPEGAHIDHGNLCHEGFHIFQYSANSPGFAYQGDSQWYIESTAQWYQAKTLPDGVMTYVEAGAIIGNPQLALWHSFSNEAPGDPTDWMYQVRQYGMHTYLVYLTEFAGVDPNFMSAGFYGSIEALPQHYHFMMVGGDSLRSIFADWAAHNTGGLDYLTPEQVERAMLELELVGDFDNYYPHVWESEGQGTEGQWIRPPEGLEPRGWGYNVFRVGTPTEGLWSVEVLGDEQGSQGAPAHFEARLLTMKDGVVTYEDVPMNDALAGSGAINCAGDEKGLFLVVAAVPEHFEGYQHYGYQVRISHDSVSEP